MGMSSLQIIQFMFAVNLNPQGIPHLDILHPLPLFVMKYCNYGGKESGQECLEWLVPTPKFLHIPIYPFPVKFNFHGSRYVQNPNFGPYREP